MSPRVIAILSVLGCVMLLAVIVVVVSGGSSPHHAIILPPTTTTHPTPKLNQYIISDDQAFLDEPGTLQQSLATAANNGYTTIRVTADWQQLAPAVRGYGFVPTKSATYNQDQWYSLDRLVREAVSVHLKVLINITGPGPSWASSHRGLSSIDTVQWHDFVSAVVNRYSGSFAPPGGAGILPAVNEYSIWNEPNLARNLLPQTGKAQHIKHRITVGHGRHRHTVTHTTTTAIPLLSPDNYRTLYLSAYTAIEQANSQATILAGELAPSASYDRQQPTGGGVAPLAFIRAVACVNIELKPIRTGSCRDYQPLPGSGFAIHPFSFGHQPLARSSARSGDLMLGDLPKLKRLLTRLVSTDRINATMNNIFITEYGYPTAGNNGAVSLADQGKLLVQAETYAADQHVQSFGQYLLADETCPSGVPIPTPCLVAYTGLETSAGQAKPALGLIGQLQTGVTNQPTTTGTSGFGPASSSP